MEIDWKGGGRFEPKGPVFDWHPGDDPRLVAVRKVQDVVLGTWSAVWEVDRVDGVAQGQPRVTTHYLVDGRAEVHDLRSVVAR